MTRRDRCYFVGKRASTLRLRQAALAWYYLAAALEGFGEKDLPKYRDVIGAIRKATIHGKSPKGI